MRKELAFITVSVFASAALYGQNPESGAQSFQLAVAGSPVNQVFRYATIGGPTVTGRPYSATEERRSSQTLGDGTRIETTETSRVFRDEQGRTRTERKDGNISIFDPVAGFTANLNPAARTAMKMTMARPIGIPRGTGPVNARIEVLRTQLAEKEKQSSENSPEVRTITNQIGDLEKVTAEQHVTELRIASPPAEFRARTPEAGQAVFGFASAGQAVAVEGGGGRNMMTFSSDTESGEGATIMRVNTGNSGAVENVPTQMVNGVLAQGTRTTETIPVGKIGNDRVINIVNERWYSNDLQILIKSSSSDPRFGNTTYQLTNILQTSPDPSLFQIPADYTIRK